MSRTINPLAIWQQVPLANRIIGAVTGNVTGSVGSATAISDKTGYSLTAGSYVVRASSTQAGTISVSSSNTSGNATISSVTTSRAVVGFTGETNDSNNKTYTTDGMYRLSLPGATTVTATRGTSIDDSDNVTAFTVEELL